MVRLLRSELRKATSMRSTWGIALAMVALVVVSVLQTSAAAEAAKPLWERQFYFLGTLHTRLFLLILGIKLATDDFRFGTIVPTALVTPKRGRVVAAKTIVAAGLGLVASLVAAGAMVGVGWADINGLSARELAGLGGFVASGALWAAIGTGVGLLVRHQLGAVVGAIVWVMALEQLFITQYDISDYLPGGAGGAFGVPEAAGPMIVGGLVLLAYTAAFAVAGTVALVRRDLP